ncbi:unnamed protein product, partial [Prorocentrum cordatum]
AGMVQPRSAYATALAARGRAAMNTLEWKQHWNDMAEWGDANIPTVRIISGTPWEEHWLAPAIGSNLRRVAMSSISGSGQ